MPVTFEVVEATVKLLPAASFTTTLIEAPFLTATEGWTDVFRVVVSVVLDAVIAEDLTGPDTFAGTTNESVFVTSPFALEITLGEIVGLGDAKGLGLTLGDAKGLGLTLGEGDGEGFTLGDGEGVAD